MLHSSNTWKTFSDFNDEEVWDQLRGGNRLALEYIYRSYAKDLFNFGMKLYGRHEWVQDSTHELFVDIWNQHKKLSAVKSLKAYLFKALKYKLQRQYSKEKCWVYKTDYEKLPSIEVELPLENTLIAAQLSKEQKLNLAKAMEKLPTRQREVLHLFYDDDLSYEEIAAIMEINVRSVYTLAWKGINSLRKTYHKFTYLSFFLPLLN